MSQRTQWLLGILGVIVVAALSYFASMSLGLGDFGAEESAPAETTERDSASDEEARALRLCNAQSTVDSIRQTVFERARAAAEGETAVLVRLEADSLARIEDPRLEGYDREYSEARCTGRFVIQTPPGTEPAFGNSRRLTATLDYVVQSGAGRRETVYRLTGINGIVDELANADLTPRRPEPDGKPRDGGDDGYDPGVDDGPTNLLPPDMGGDSPKR